MATDAPRAATYEVGRPHHATVGRGADGLFHAMCVLHETCGWWSAQGYTDPDEARLDAMEHELREYRPT